MTGAFPRAAYCDRGYQGSAGLIFSTDVYVQGKSSNEASDTVKKKLRGRAAIEPVIGHMKQDHRLDRDVLLGKRGDQFNAVMAGCGFNLRKLYRAVLLRFFATVIECVLAFRPAFS